MLHAQTIVEGGWRNKLAYLGLADLQMPIIHTWNISLNMWTYHANYRRALPPAGAFLRCEWHGDGPSVAPAVLHFRKHDSMKHLICLHGMPS